MLPIEAKVPQKINPPCIPALKCGALWRKIGKNSITFKMIIWAARSRGNGDRLIQGMMSHAKQHGNESVFLGILLEKFGYDMLGGPPKTATPT